MAGKAFYYPRSVDTELLKSVRDWMDSGAFSGWVAITSQPGRGNTYLLEHLHRHLEAKPFRSTVASLFVRGRTAGAVDSPEPELPPVAAALFEVHSRTRDSARVKLSRTLRHGGMARMLAYVLTTLMILALITLAVGFFEYATQDTPDKYSWSWYRQFPAYVQNHGADVPLWLLLSLLITALTAALTSLHRVILVPAPPRKPNEAEIDRFKSLRDESQAVDILWEVTAGRRALIVLVDDAYALTAPEQLFVLELHSTPLEKHALKEFHSNHRVLIVSIEMETPQGALAKVPAWDEQKPRRLVTAQLKVKPFELDQVAQIAKKRFGSTGDDNMRLIEAAQHNINALFQMEDERTGERVVAEFDEAFEKDLDSELGYADVLALIAVGGQDYETRDEMSRWLRLKDSRMLREHLAVFGLEPSQSSAKVLDDLKTSNLVRVSGRTYFFDEYGRLSLRRYLAHQATAEPKRLVLARAHLYWFWYHAAATRALGVTPDTLGTILPAHHTSLKRAMWHIAELEQNFDVNTVLADTKLDSARHAEFRRSIAVVSGTAAAVYASEGRLTESDDCVIEAIEWVPDLEGEWKLWAERLMRQLWNNYWLTARGVTRCHLENLIARRPSLETTAIWQTARNLEDWMACADGPSYAIEGDLLDPELRDWRALGDFLWRCRRTHGFLMSALRDSAIDVLAAPRSSGSLVSVLMFYLRCSAEVFRGASAGRVETLKLWRKQLSRGEALAGNLTLEAMIWCQHGMYWQLLANVRTLADMSAAPETPATGQADGRSFPDELRELALPDRINSDQDDYPLHAQAAYDRALHLAMLLGLNGLALHVHHELAWLLLLHTPAHDRNQVDWWQVWDRSFETCLEVQTAHAASLAELKPRWPGATEPTTRSWKAHAAPIHAIRYEFFSRQTATGSVQDAMLAYRAVRDAHYPQAQQLWWFSKAKLVLGNYAQTEEQHRASAEMYVEWARRMVLLKEAAPWREFEFVEYDQAKALSFAAQSSRNLEDYLQSDALLTEAEQLYASAPGPKDEGPVKEQGMWLRLHRLWLASARRDDNAFAKGIRGLWPLIERQHSVAAALLVSRVRLENKLGVLEESLAEPGRDDENDSLSVPPHCLLRTLPATTRFELRFHQLLHLVLAQCSPSPADLEAAAARDWENQNKYSEHVLAALEFANKARAGSLTMAALPGLLSYLHSHFATVDPQFELELQALNLLIRLDPTDREKWVAAKRASLTTHHALLVRQAGASAAASSSLVACASMVHKWLSEYEDSGYRRRLIAERLVQGGWSAETFHIQSDSRSRALETGRRLAASGLHAEAMACIGNVLPVGGQAWVLLDDLELMELALQIAPHLDGPGYDVSAWITQTRALSLQYIRQFVNTVSERDVQLLAVELLEAVEGQDAGYPALEA